MKKIVITVTFVAIFVAYSLYQFFSASQAPIYTTTSPQPVASTKKDNPVASGSEPTQTKPTTSIIPAPSAKSGLYADGTFTGSVADAYFGNVQVEAVIQNGKISDVKFLQYPSDRSASLRKSQMAIPVLKSEAIAVQSANVDIVSGATETSKAFQESLGNALSQAKNS